MWTIRIRHSLSLQTEKPIPAADDECDSEYFSKANASHRVEGASNSLVGDRRGFYELPMPKFKHEQAENLFSIVPVFLVSS